MQAKNPIPLIGCQDGLPGPCGQLQFPPKCNETECTGMGDAVSNLSVLTTLGWAMRSAFSPFSLIESKRCVSLLAS